MMPLVRDLLRKDVHHPEEHDQHDRNEEDHEQREERRQRVFGLGREKRGMRVPGERQEERDREEAAWRADTRSARRRSEVNPGGAVDGLVWSVIAVTRCTKQPSCHARRATHG